MKLLLPLYKDKIGAYLEKQWASFVFLIFAKILLLLVLLSIGFLLIHLFTKEYINRHGVSVLMTATLADLLLKWIIVKPRFPEFGFLSLHLGKRRCLHLLLLLSLSQFSFLVLPVLSILYADFRILIICLVVSLLNLFFVILLKIHRQYLFLVIYTALPVLILLSAGSPSIGQGLLFSGFFGLNVLIVAASCRYTEDRLYADRLSTVSRNLILPVVGSSGPTLTSNEWRLFLRNRRGISLLFQGLLVSLAGLVYILDGGVEHPVILFNAAIFFTGGFLLALWQLLFTLDGEYFPFIFVHTTSRAYLQSKLRFMYFLLTAAFLLSVPLVIQLLPDWLPFVIASFLFNVGVSVKILLYFGLYNRGMVDLGSHPFRAYEDVNRFQYISFSLVFLISISLSYFTFSITNPETALVWISLVGLAGLLFNRHFTRLMCRKLQTVKHNLISSANG